MAELDISKSTTTDLAGSVSDVNVATKTPDQESAGEAYWDFPDAGKHLGYYKTIPEIKSALHVLAQRVCGLGYEVLSPETQVILESMQGWGKETTTSILMQLLIEKKVYGDSFAEIIRSDDGTLINLKKLYTGNMRIVVDEKGLIDRYESRNPISREIKKFQPNEIFHLSNNRTSNEIHGTSIIESLKIIIDAKNEALSDERKIRHRELALGVLEVDTDDATKLGSAKSSYQDAVNKGEVLVLPKGTAELKDNPNQPRDRIQWLQYLDNLFYQVVGTPKVLVTSEGFTEAGGKAGLLAFEPVELSEKKQLEEDIWNQLSIRIKFSRAPSLLGDAVGTEQKNAGQTGVQQNETQVRPTRTE